MKENVDPYAYHDKDTNHNKPSKLVPVNLIKSLASLSMNSHTGDQDKEEEEVLSKSNPIVPNAAIPEATPMHTRLIDQNPDSHQEFIFATSKDKPQSLPPNMTEPQETKSTSSQTTDRDNQSQRNNVLRVFLLLKRERVPSHNGHPSANDHVDVELSGYGESPNSSQHPRDL
ncbi:hypothetical protein PIB30_073620 [Stylosanthes scabra]|uniref:Uncharacterized protein n=1 Tax=Stylosanthes scabra TaxID=79078 RepID=A0ABU6TP27_9FABA|nr:hypothetical protein [Stylosanthes scabra]